MTMRTPPPPAELDWPICYSGVCLIAEFEGYSLAAYRCPAGVWTCGRGETQGVTAATRWTPTYVEERFADSLRQYAHEVRTLCRGAEPTAPQLAAMVSLAYNIGLGAFAKSSVLKAHLRGDRQAAARAFKLWDKARINGQLKVLAGLTRRRAAEQALYLQPDEHEAPDVQVQAVATEASLAASPIANAGVVTAGGGALTLLSQAQDHVAAARPLLDTGRELLGGLGLQPLVALGALMVAAGLVAAYWRYRQRRDGWA